jgi:hypothetical protein
MVDPGEVMSSFCGVKLNLGGLYQSVCLAAGYVEGDADGLLAMVSETRAEDADWTVQGGHDEMKAVSRVLGRNVMVMGLPGDEGAIIREHGAEVGDPVLLCDEGNAQYTPVVKKGRLGMPVSGRKFEVQRLGQHWKVEGWERDESALAGRSSGWKGVNIPGKQNGGAAGMFGIGAEEGGGKRELKPTLAHAGFIGDRTVVIGWDTYCQPNAIRESLVDPAWEVVDQTSMDVVGVGEATIGRLLRVPIRLRYAAEELYVEVRVTKDSMMPAGCDILFGTRLQKEMGVVLDARQERLEMWNLGFSIVQEELWVIRSRMDSKPLIVLDLCAGSSGSYSVFRDMGWSIGDWHAVENNEAANTVVQELYGGRVKLIATDVGDFICEEYYDVVLAGPPCQPWSRLNERALGFKDPRSAAFIHCCRIINEAMKVNAEMRFMLENVPIKNELQEDEQTQEDYLGWGFEELDACWCGAQSRRRRRVAQNVVDTVGDLEGRTPADPNLSLNCLGASTVRRLIGCVVASGSNTKAAMTVMDDTAGIERHASLDELEALVGYPREHQLLMAGLS